MNIRLGLQEAQGSLAFSIFTKQMRHFAPISGVIKYFLAKKSIFEKRSFFILHFDAQTELFLKIHMKLSCGFYHMEYRIRDF